MKRKHNVYFLGGSRTMLSIIPNNTIIHFNDRQIKSSDFVKNLSLYFDKYMLFDTHVTELTKTELTKKTFELLMYINRIRTCLASRPEQL